jgi:hypothetical protein
MNLTIKLFLLSVLGSVLHPPLVSLFLLVDVHSVTSDFSVFAPQEPASELKLGDAVSCLTHEDKVYSNVNAVNDDHDYSCVHSHPFYRLEFSQANGCVHHCKNHEFIEVLHVVIPSCFKWQCLPDHNHTEYRAQDQSCNLEEKHITEGHSQDS